MNSVARKGILQLISSAAMAILQLIQIGVLARTFSGAALGVVALYSMTVAIVTVFSDFGLQSYIVQDKRPSKATAADVAIVLPIFVFIGLASCIFGVFIFSRVLPSNDVRNALIWIAPTIPFVMFMGPLQGFAIREFRFERLAIAEAAGKLASVFLVFFLAKYHHLVGCVMIAFYATLIVKLVYMHEDVLYLVRLLRTQTTGSLRNTLSYALAQVLGQIANMLAAKADELIVAATMSLATFGIYASMKQFVVQAVAFISPMIRRITMPLFAELRRNGVNSSWTIAQLIGWSNSTYVGFFLVLGLNAEIVTKCLYGHAFITHADWLSWFAFVWSLRTLAGGTISAYLQSTGAPFSDLFWTTLQAVVQISVQLIAASRGIEIMLACAALSYGILAIVGHLSFLGKRAMIKRNIIIFKLLLPIFVYYAISLILRFMQKKFDTGWWLEPIYGLVLLVIIIALVVKINGYRELLVGVKPV